jgi:hypothetical protein
VYYLAKTLQFAGILFFPGALYLGIVRDDLRGELLLAATGLVIFGVGWWIDRHYA